MGVWAQASELPGWLGVLTNAGAFAVLAYLVIHFLPRMVERWAVVQETTAREHAGAVKGLVEAFQGEQRYEREQCQQHFARLIDVVERTQSATMSALHNVESLVRTHHAFSQKAVEKLAEAVPPPRGDGE